MKQNGSSVHRISARVRGYLGWMLPLFLLLLFLLLLGDVARAESELSPTPSGPEATEPEDDRTGPEDDRIGPARCVALLGDHSTREANRQRRKRYLHWISEDAFGITVVQSNVDWEEPVKLDIEGVSLVQGSANEDRGAVIDISTDLADRLGCVPGQHTLRRDDSLGPRIRILSLLKQAVLVEHEGRLGYISTARASETSWLVAWYLRGVSIPIDVGRSRSSPQPRRQAPKRRAPKRAPPKKARPKRR
jgi:hypothetical protein